MRGHKLVNGVFVKEEEDLKKDKLVKEIVDEINFWLASIGLVKLVNFIRRKME